MVQYTRRFRRSLVVVLGLSAGLAAMATGFAQSSAGKWWTGYGNGPDNSRYFASRQINKSNVNTLQAAWTYPFGDTGGNPIVARGVIYGRGRNGSIVAVNAATGKELWVRENMNGMSSRGMMYWESRDGRDQRPVFPMSSLLQQLDAKTGKSVTSFGINGAVDLRVGIDGRDPETIANIQSQTPGEVFENLIILGSAPGEGYMSPPGDIRAYDARTGKLAWTFHTVPRPGEFGYDTWPKDAWKYIGGVNNWGEMTIDASRGIAYVPLGSPTYDYYGADRIGANLFGSSIVALDARTGKRLWHFQMVHHDLWDFDNNAAPQLTTIRHNGRRRDVVAVAGKTGWLYVFDRVTGEPIWPIEERPVPQTDMPGEQTWPTQPYPTNPPPFAKQSFGVDDINPYREPADYERFKQRVLAANNKGLFTPINSYRHGSHSRQQRRRAVRRHRSRAGTTAPSTSSRRTIRACFAWSDPARPAREAGLRDYESTSSTASSVTVRIVSERARVCRWFTRVQIPRTRSWPARPVSVRWRSATFSTREGDACRRSRTSAPLMLTS